MTIIDSFVGEENNESNFKIEMYNAGTAKLLTTADAQEGVKTTTLDKIIEKNNIREQDVDLIKIDTDGFDFKIIHSMDAFITKNRPSIFFEYDIHFNENGEVEGIRTINRLSELKYDFVVYDNFGNLLMCIQSNSTERFKEVNNYLKSCLKNKGGINYVDILAIPKEDKNLLNEILTIHTQK